MTLRRFSSAKKFMCWPYRLERSFQLVIGHADRLQECIPARVRFEVREERIPPHTNQARIALLTRSLEPFERLVFLPTVRVDLGDLIGCGVGETFLQSSQRHI